MNVTTEQTATAEYFSADNRIRCLYFSALFHIQRGMLKIAQDIVREHKTVVERSIPNISEADRPLILQAYETVKEDIHAELRKRGYHGN